MGVIPLQASWTQKADGCRLYRYRVAFHRNVRAAHARELHQLGEDADNRVQSVIKQFEWAVNDLARLKTQLETSESTLQTLTERAREREHQNEQLIRQISRLRERLAEIAMAASLNASGRKAMPRLFEAIPFEWGLHLEGVRARLELSTRDGDASPSRLRVLDRDGQIVAASGVSIVSADGTLEFEIEPPLDLVADLEVGHDISYKVEALVDVEWRPVRLIDTGRRTTTAVDISGHLSRVSAAFDAPRVTVSVEGRGPALN
jgi:hypothetical protein